MTLRVPDLLLPTTRSALRGAQEKQNLLSVEVPVP